MANRPTPTHCELHAAHLALETLGPLEAMKAARTVREVVVLEEAMRARGREEKPVQVGS